MFGNHANCKNVDLHLGIPECQIYHSPLTGSKSQIELDCLQLVHILDRVEDDQDKSWELLEISLTFIPISF
jgi:hypothetical protein